MRRAALLGLFVYLLLLIVGTGCKPAMEPRDSIAHVDQRVAIGFAAARTVVGLLDAAEVYYLDEGTRTKAFVDNDPKFDASQKRITALQLVRSNLERVRLHLADAVPNDLKQVLAALVAAASEAKAAGVHIPGEVTTTLKTLQEVLP